MLFPNPDRGKESIVSQYVDDARETPGDALVTPLWRPRMFTLPPVHVESGLDGLKRRAWYEQVSENGHQRGR